MKTPSFIILLALSASAALADDKLQTKVTPQPRVRLDPVSRAVILPPKSEIKTRVQSGAIVMDKVVVKEERSIPNGPSHPEEHKGRLSATEGGYALRGSLDKMRWEIGAWSWVPWTDVMWEDLKKFPKLKTRIDVDVVRIHW
jgi:hypothetical protein